MSELQPLSALTRVEKTALHPAYRPFMLFWNSLLIKNIIKHLKIACFLNISDYWTTGPSNYRTRELWHHQIVVELLNDRTIELSDSRDVGLLLYTCLSHGITLTLSVCSLVLLSLKWRAVYIQHFITVAELKSVLKQTTKYMYMQI